jgi:UDP-N-acetylmuramate dehydrogenase
MTGLDSPAVGPVVGRTVGPAVGAAVRLADLTTLRVGGPALRLVTARSEPELVAAVAEADAAGEPVLLVGGGSNLVVADEGFPGVVVRIASRGLRVASADRCGGANVWLAAGEPWDAVVDRAVTEGWAGVEALSGIPGAVGATPVQNVGAYGQEVCQTLAAVRVWDRRDRRIATFPLVECGFGYRTSRFKAERFGAGLGRGPRYVVLEACLQLPLSDLSTPIRYAELARALGLEPGGRAPLARVREAVLALRRGKGMVLDDADPDTVSCGSFFTNPVLGAGAAAALPAAAPRYPAPDGQVKTSAAWLIEHAGFAKGFGLPGPAALSAKHTLALTNRGGARTADVLALARRIRDGVRERFGVELAPEPVLVGCEL